MALLDVNVLVALAFDTHVHHVASRRWFAERAGSGWSTCPTTETAFVRLSSNRRVLVDAISTDAARTTLAAMRQAGSHRFLVDDVSPTDADAPQAMGHRQVTDAHLLAVARRNGVPLVTFDRGLAALGDGVEVLTA